MRKGFKLRSVLVFFGLLLLLSFVACRKEYMPEQPANTSQLKVPANFKWNSTRDIAMKLSLPTTGLFPLQSKVTVYQGDPFAEGVIISSGSISVQKPFEIDLRVPSHLKSLFLHLESSVGAEQWVEVPISGNTLQYTFSANTNAFLNKAVVAMQDAGPECNDCFQVISGSGDVTISQGRTYCVQGSFTGTVTFQTWNGGGTLKVCGTATLNQNISLGTNSHFVITKGGTLTINGIQMWGTNNSIQVYANSQLNISGGLTTTGQFINHGAISIGQFTTFQLLNSPLLNTGTIQVNSGININSVALQNGGTIAASGPVKFNSGSSIVNNGTFSAGDLTELNSASMENNGVWLQTNNRFSINGGSSLTNNGTITIQAGSFNVNSNGLIVNNGSVTAASQINFNSGSNITNNCFMSCEGQAEFNSGQIILNNGYFRSNDRIQINGGSATSLRNGSMISAPRIFLYANLTSQGNTSTIKTSTSFTMSSQTVSGAIELSTPLLNILPGTPVSQHFINGATVVTPGNETNFLAITPCNPEGVGSVTIVDSDNDGVPDDLDDFPNDPTRAFRSWYPNQFDFTTIAFEDLWPGMGDFDFNDVVVIMQYEMITNAQNQLVDLKGKFRLMAAGASLNNGFGVAININPSNVASVTGGNIAGNLITFDPKGMEAGHTNQTVWIVMDAINDLYPGPDFLNTVPELPYVITDTITMSMTLSTPQANFGTAPFNPFIFVNQDRGKEVHLLDMPPTALADPAFFGTMEDRSNPAMNTFYKTDSNLPWAIEIPVSFDYPIEKVDILQTHLKFGAWATSGGAEFTDWYLNKMGYRNQQNIYQKPSGK